MLKTLQKNKNNKKLELPKFKFASKMPDQIAFV